ncbi:MAG TPA: hypothetical protein VFM25_14015 [Verrucomicrobiae bacterium]|nr:hypothetical protein [Verrucomicrobiae bacterium]
MRKFTGCLTILAIALGAAISVSAADNSAHDALENRINQINQDSKREGINVTLQRISTETGVSLDQVKSLHKNHSNVGPGGLMIACVLADETRKTPEQFLKNHTNGKNWGALARANNVSIDKLTQRLDRLDKAIGHDTSNANKNKKKAK